MADYIKCSGFGRCGKDPEIHYTPEGKAVANVNVGCDVEGETRWYTLVLWEDAAEEFANKVKKGDQVAFLGKLDVKHKGDAVYRDVTAWQVWSTDFYWEKPRTA